MHFTILLLAISFFGLPALASTYEVGNQVCNMDEAVNSFNESPENLSSREELARCLIIEGLALNQSLSETQGLDELVRMSEKENRISASYFLLQYYWTGRTFHADSDFF